MEVAPLIPLGTDNNTNKSTKKNNNNSNKRPGFRPVGKTKGKLVNPGIAGSSSSSGTSRNVAAKITTPKQLEEHGNFHNVPYTESGIVATTVHHSSAPVSIAATSATRRSTQTPSVNAGTRKRKQSTGVSITLRRNQPGSTTTTTTTTTQNSRPATRQRKSTPTVIPDAAAMAPTRVGTGLEQASDSSRAKANASLPLRTVTRRSTALVVANTPALMASVPAVPPQDQHLLQRLASENPDALRLRTFCSVFKGKKQPRTKRKGTGTNAAQRTNNTSNNINNKGSKNNNDAQSHTNKTTTNNSNNVMTPDVTGAPVVKIVDGEIVLQESSLVVPGQRRTVQEVEEEFQDVVEEDAQLAIVGASYNSFVNRKGPQHWTVDDTKRFFEGLRQMGTDFCSMEAFFENRTRKQLKRKYRQELIRNPALVEMALDPKNRTAVDLSIFDVEVDPKAIEEAAKDVPPPYIPTDVEKTLVPEVTDDNAPSAVGDAVAIAAAIAAGNTVQEVVEEDAEEEERDARADSNKLSVSFADQESSIWPSGKEDDAYVQEVDADEFGELEPSMDDFFQEQGDMADAPSPDEEMTPVETAPPTPPVPTVLPVVSSKSSTKAKKPKFRTTSRKKKM